MNGFPLASSGRAREWNGLQQSYLCAGGQPGMLEHQVGPCPKARPRKVPWAWWLAVEESPEVWGKDSLGEDHLLHHQLSCHLTDEPL